MFSCWGHPDGNTIRHWLQFVKNFNKAWIICRLGSSIDTVYRLAFSIFFLCCSLLNSSAAIKYLPQVSTLVLTVERRGVTLKLNKQFTIFLRLTALTVFPTFAETVLYYIFCYLTCMFMVFLFRNTQ